MKVHRYFIFPFSIFCIAKLAMFINIEYETYHIPDNPFSYLSINKDIWETYFTWVFLFQIKV